MNNRAKYYISRNIVSMTDCMYSNKNKTITLRNINKRKTAYTTNKEKIKAETMSSNTNETNLENPKETDKLYSMYRETLKCEKCVLSKTRNNVVFGKGNENAKIIFIGEAPGADEDRLGFPFVGRGGRLLDTWLSSSNLTLDDVYVMNAVKCRPPENRDPSEEEKISCRSYFDKQINIINPKIICALGKHAFANLVDFDMKDTFSKMRGVVHYYKNIPVIATYHPAFILRNNNFASKIEEDFKLLLSEYKKTVN